MKKHNWFIIDGEIRTEKPMTAKELENMVEKGILKKEYKDSEIYVKSEDGTFEKVIKKCWVYETVE